MMRELEVLNASQVLLRIAPVCARRLRMARYTPSFDQPSICSPTPAYARYCKERCSEPKTAQKLVHLLRLQAFQHVIDGYGTLVTALSQLLSFT